VCGRLKIDVSDPEKVSAFSNWLVALSAGVGMGDMDLPPETLVQQAPYQNDSSNPLKMDTSEMAGQLPAPKPRKKRQRRTDKPPKPPAEKKKRGRKSKMDKLMVPAAADAIHAGLSSQPGGDWARANSSGVFIPGEMMNGPQPHDFVNDVNMRRASLDNQLSEVIISMLLLLFLFWF
jgi:hypothetical protein